MTIIIRQNQKQKNVDTKFSSNQHNRFSIRLSRTIVHAGAGDSTTTQIYNCQASNAPLFQIRVPSPSFFQSLSNIN